MPDNFLSGNECVGVSLELYLRGGLRAKIPEHSRQKTRLKATIFMTKNLCCGTCFRIPFIFNILIWQEKILQNWSGNK